MSITIYDTTLRDGTQAEDINLSFEDKIRIAQRLDDLGVHYIEGGWPASNPTDLRFFQEIGNYRLARARVAAFGSTHNPKVTADQDDNLRVLTEVGVEVITIFGKSWDIHVREALRTTLAHNLEMIAASLAFLRPRCRELFFDAEHFFDGFKQDADYALACLEKAHAAGADALVLCDTNGGTLPHEVAQITERVVGHLPQAQIGIHCHNDCELAVANSLAAVQRGARQVQGTFNGYGERCGNANLCSIIPVLELKMGMPCLPEGKLAHLTSTSLYVSEVANIRHYHRQPFVGRSAFAHKGGIHVSAVRRNPRTYEHISPEEVGNKQRILLSDLAGQSNILFKAKQYGYDLDKGDPFILDLLSQLKERESRGYEYAAAEASFELLLNRSLGRLRTYFSLLGYRVIDSMRQVGVPPISEATVMVKVGGEVEHTAASGQGPVNALDNALRKALKRFYPNLSRMRLLDFKVRVLTHRSETGVGGTASSVRVLIESGDTSATWTTVGVSYDIIEASWEALEDSITYKLFKDEQSRVKKVGTDENS